MGGALADGFFGEEGLLADTVGDFGEFALIGANSGKVIGLADEIKRAESFPDLLVARVDGGDFGAGGYMGTRSHEEGADTAADGRAKLESSQLVLRSFDRRVDLNFCDEAALVNGGASLIGIRNAARKRSNDSGGLEKRDDLRAAGIIAKADERKGGVSPDHGRRVLEHFEDRLMKALRGSVLPHDPGVGVADFFDRMRGQADQFRIPERRCRVAASHALAELNQGVLNVARM